MLHKHWLCVLLTGGLQSNTLCTHVNGEKGGFPIMRDNWKTAFMGSLSGMPRNEPVELVAPNSLSKGSYNSPIGAEASSFLSIGVAMSFNFPKGNKIPDFRQLQFPAIPQVAGVQVQTVRCLSPGPPTQACPCACIVQRNSNMVADSFTGIQPLSRSCCACPAYLSHISTGLRENKGPVRLLRPCTKWHLLVFHTGFCVRGSKKKIQDSLILYRRT